jgi:hypothetical protein
MKMRLMLAVSVKSRKRVFWSIVGIIVILCQLNKRMIHRAAPDYVQTSPETFTTVFATKLV